MPKVLKVKKELEYEDAPSGFVTLYNYKEPFMKFEQGHGYQGVLLFDGESDHVQCHFCGEWFVQLGNHINREHNMRASEYKSYVGLNQSTALIGEKLREKLVASGMEKRLRNLKNRKGKKVTEETKAKIKETLKNYTTENKNLRGTCPAQLIARLKALYQERGYTPHVDDISFYAPLKLTYGSLKNACEVAGIPYRRPGQTIDNPRWYKKEEVISYFRSFAEREGRFPTRKDAKNEGQKHLWDAMVRNKWGQKKIEREAALAGSFLPVKTKIRYGKDGIIKSFQMFKQVHGRSPSVSDAKRRLIPAVGTIYYQFGNFKNALKASGM